jgi:hypothetical protein
MICRKYLLSQSSILIPYLVGVGLTLFWIGAFVSSQEPPSLSDTEWVTPRFEEDHAAKTQFSNDPGFKTFVEGRYNGKLPDGTFVGPYDGQTDLYKYARTTEERRIKWRYVPLYYFDSGRWKVGGYDRRYPDVQTQIEVQRYWYDMPRPPDRYKEQLAKDKQDALRRQKAELEKQLKEIEGQIE